MKRDISNLAKQVVYEEVITFDPRGSKLIFKTENGIISPTS